MGVTQSIGHISARTGFWTFVDGTCEYYKPLKPVKKKKQTNSMVWVRERTRPTERPPLVGEAIANFWG
jgi:hypothetical protein